MDLFDVISNDIKEAMKAKDKVKLETLRNVKMCIRDSIVIKELVPFDDQLQVFRQVLQQFYHDAASPFEPDSLIGEMCIRDSHVVVHRRQRIRTPPVIPAAAFRQS